MDKEMIAAKIQALQQKAQERLNALAQADPIWCNTQGWIGAYNEMLGEMKDGGNVQKPDKENRKMGSQNAQA